MIWGMPEKTNNRNLAKPRILPSKWRTRLGKQRLAFRMGRNGPLNHFQNCPVGKSFLGEQWRKRELWRPGCDVRGGWTSKQRPFMIHSSSHAFSGHMWMYTFWNTCYRCELPFLWITAISIQVNAFCLSTYHLKCSLFSKDCVFTMV